MLGGFNYSLSEIEVQGYSIAPFNDSIIALPSPTLLQNYSGEAEVIKLDIPGQVTKLWFKPKNGVFDLMAKKVLPWPWPNTKNPAPRTSIFTTRTCMRPSVTVLN